MMNNKLIFLGLIIPVLMLLLPNAYASDFSSHNQRDRPAINPDFDPDQSCNFDAYQLKCIPGSEQDCYDIEGFAQNEDYTCHVSGPCPEGYHGRDDDETGQCYPDSEGCEWDGYVMLEREDGKGNTCSVLYLLCDQEEHKEEEYCIEYCNEGPNRMGCKPEVS